MPRILENDYPSVPLASSLLVLDDHDKRKQTRWNRQLANGGLPDGSYYCEIRNKGCVFRYIHVYNNRVYNLRPEESIIRIRSKDENYSIEDGKLYWFTELK